MTDELQTRKVNGSASFRYLSLTDSEAAELKILIPTAEFGRHHQTGRNVGSCDVFISIYSDRNDEVWRAPKTVNHIVNVVNCPIVFSFTGAYPETRAQPE